MPLAIPITLAMTFGVSYMLGIDLQQVSVATLIIALGLLVDVPVVAGDGIKRGLAEGLPRRVAAWLGPTKLATAIFYATLTNIIAYLPFLLLRGNTGEFLKSLPIVMTTALLCALVVAMTFVPLLGYYIQRPPATKEATIEEILCFPAPGAPASEVLAPIEPKLVALEKRLPPGYQLQIGGEKAKQVDGFTNLAVVLLISLVGIYLAMLIQFNNAVKPLLVFAAAPYGAIGALIALAIMGTPFGFMAFLGVASLVG